MLAVAGSIHMAHPDEKLLPCYIGQLLTREGVKDLAQFLEQNYPDTFQRLRSELGRRYKALAPPRGNHENR